MQWFAISLSNSLAARHDPLFAERDYITTRKRCET